MQSPFCFKCFVKATTPIIVFSKSHFFVVKLVALAKDLNMKVSKDKRRKFYKSRAWLKKRKEIVERDNNECQLCKSKGYATVGQNNYLDVHHMVHLEDSWERRLDDDNLITLCRPCHNSQHPEKLKDFHSEVHAERFE